MHEPWKDKVLNSSDMVSVDNNSDLVHHITKVVDSLKPVEMILRVQQIV